MKKAIAIFFCTAFVFTCGCSEKKDADRHISQLRYDILYTETDFCDIYAFKEKRENPLSDDGETGETFYFLTFKIAFKNENVLRSSPVIKFSLGGIDYRKEFEYKPLSNFVVCSLFVPEPPESKLTATITFDDEEKPFTLLSVLDKKTLGYDKIIDALKKSKDGDVDEFFDKRSKYEMRIRLIYSDGYKCYYVGLIDETEKIEFLIDGETGEILAKKKQKNVE